MNEDWTFITNWNIGTTQGNANVVVCLLHEVFAYLYIHICTLSDTNLIMLQNIKLHLFAQIIQYMT